MSFRIWIYFSYWKFVKGMVQKVHVCGGFLYLVGTFERIIRFWPLITFLLSKNLPKNPVPVWAPSLVRYYQQHKKILVYFLQSQFDAMLYLPLSIPANMFVIDHFLIVRNVGIKIRGQISQLVKPQGLRKCVTRIPPSVELAVTNPVGAQCVISSLPSISKLCSFYTRAKSTVLC